MAGVVNINQLKQLLAQRVRGHRRIVLLLTWCFAGEKCNHMRVQNPWSMVYPLLARFKNLTVTCLENHTLTKKHLLIMLLQNQLLHLHLYSFCSMKYFFAHLPAVHLAHRNYKLP